MSTLRVTTISNAGGTKTVPADTVVDGTAKAWVNFNGTGTVAIRGQFNVTSITDLGVGYYRVNFTSAMTDANYAVAFAAGNVNAGTFGYYQVFAIGTSSFDIQYFVPSALTDVPNICAATFR